MRAGTVVALSTLACALGVLASACATAGVSDDTSGGDGQASDGTTGTDGGNGNCPTGYAGTGCKSCAGGFHTCGSSCEQDHPNAPDAGCAQGCNGASCPAPTNSTAKCTSEGQCDFACNTSFDKGDGGCACPSGQVVCAGVCKECCNDADCVGHQLCNSGVCSGCQPNYADCNNNKNDGCEADLSKEPNCGSCGTSCCGWGISCCFTDLHGKSCKTSGNSYSCQC